MSAHASSRFLVASSEDEVEDEADTQINDLLAIGAALQVQVNLLFHVCALVEVRTFAS